jgi:hypothetical protein
MKKKFQFFIPFIGLLILILIKSSDAVEVTFGFKNPINGYIKQTKNKKNLGFIICI